MHILYTVAQEIQLKTTSVPHYANK